MSVNNMSIEQAYTLINAIHAQATGNTTLTATDSASFTSVAQATLAAGYEPVLGAITQVLNKTLIAVRPYSRKFAGLEVSSDRWGAITRKINFADRGAEADATFALVDGASIDQYEVKKADILETRYLGSDVYQGHYTIYTRQLDVAFSSAEEFGRFMSGLMTHFSNEREQWLENLSRTLVANFIGAEVQINNTESVVHLLTEYNTATGASPAFTAQTIRQPANWKPFCQWVYARVAGISRLMTERSSLFQQKITGKAIIRHTPLADQKVYFLADFMESMDAEVLADAYHDNFLRYSDVEKVSFWQAIDSPDEISLDPCVYIDATATVATATVAEDNIIGVIFDRDACGYNIYQNDLQTSPYNAAGQYYNIFSHVRVQTQNDLTEKGCVLLLD